MTVCTWSIVQRDWKPNPNAMTSLRRDSRNWGPQRWKAGKETTKPTRSLLLFVKSMTQLVRVGGHLRPTAKLKKLLNQKSKKDLSSTENCAWHEFCHHLTSAMKASLQGSLWDINWCWHYLTEALTFATNFRFWYLSFYCMIKGMVLHNLRVKWWDLKEESPLIHPLQ